MPSPTGRQTITAIFFLNGAVFSAWYARLPAIQDKLDLGPGEIGVALLGAPAALLVAQPAFEVGVDLRQVIEQGADGRRLPERRHLDVDTGPAADVGPQAGRDPHVHPGVVPTGAHGSSAARTTSTSGRWRTISDHESPSSRLANTSPARVPK